VLRDTDAPGGNFAHWLVWNIPGATTAVPENGLSGATLGKNDAGRVGYFGPMPPGGRHHYHFVVYALDTTLDLPAGASLGKLQAAMKGHVVGQGELIGTYAP
jgi:Raf kinase inhibitor-like YbhB/YbcL family protein